jgi:uncharacterized protein
MKGKTALITGASGGIGEELAKQMAAKGYDLILIARNQDMLEQLAQNLSSQWNIHAIAIALDLSRAAATQEIIKELETLGLKVDVLINNAAFGDYGQFASSDPNKIEQMIHLNILTLTTLTRALLPAMLERKWGRVMNVASTAAFMPGPLLSVYYASKAYVLSFSEAVDEELKGSGVTVTCLCPGPTETGFQARAGMQESKLVKGRKMMSVTEVVQQGIEALEREQRLVIPGVMNQLQALAPRFVPRSLMPRIVKYVQRRSNV